MLLKKLFAAIEDMNDNLENKIGEISVKYSSISISFSDMSCLKINDFKALNDMFNSISVSSITAFQDEIHVHFEDLSDDIWKGEEENNLYNLYVLILLLREKLCTCPALEYVISESYLKIYVDLPNIHVGNLVDIDKALSSEGIIEFNYQRPYILYVRDW